MTIQQFKETIKNRHKSDDRINYFYCIIIIAIGLCFLGKTILDLNSFKDQLSKVLVFIVPLIFILFGLYAFWRIPKEYEVFCIKIPKFKDYKLALLEEYLVNKDVTDKHISDEILTIRYKNKHLNMVDINIFLDENNLLLNVQGVDQSGHKGFIDFGLTKRAKENLENYLKNKLY